MTISEAKKELERRLIFGDEKQIKAIRFLNAVHDALSTIEDCKEHEEDIKNTTLKDQKYVELLMEELAFCCCREFSYEALAAAIELVKLKAEE